MRLVWGAQGALPPTTTRRCRCWRWRRAG